MWERQRREDYMGRKRSALLALLVLAALALGGCRFVVLESDSVRVEAPTRQPREQSMNNQ